MSKQRIWASVVSIAACATIATAGTYAVLTDKSKTDITVTSATIDVVATLENLQVYSPTMIAADGTLVDDTNAAVMTESTENQAAVGGVFANGGWATLGENAIMLNNMTSGDKATFDVKVTNKSTVAIKYQTVIQDLNDTGLFEEIVVTIDDEVYDGSVIKSSWQTVSRLDKEEVLDVMKVSVELPTTAGDTYQNKETTLSVTVNAVQSNAEAALETNERRAHNDEELAQILSDLDGVETIWLDGSFGATQLPAGTTNITLKAANAQATMESLNLYGAKNVTIDGITFDAAKAVTVITNSNKAIGEPTNYTASIYDSRYDGAGFVSPTDNITIRNCKFIGDSVVDYEHESGYSAICIDNSGAGDKASNYIVKNNIFACDAVSYVYFNYMKAGNVIIEGNIFGGEDYKTAYGNVAIVNGHTDAVITGNTFYNWDTADSAIKASCPTGTLETSYNRYSITNNTFCGTVEDKAVIEIRRTGINHVVSGNNYDSVSGAGRTFSDDDTSTEDSNVTVYFRP